MTILVRSVGCQLTVVAAGSFKSNSRSETHSFSDSSRYPSWLASIACEKSSNQIINASGGAMAHLKGGTRYETRATNTCRPLRLYATACRICHRVKMIAWFLLSLFPLPSMGWPGSSTRHLARLLPVLLSNSQLQSITQLKNRRVDATRPGRAVASAPADARLPHGDGMS